MDLENNIYTLAQEWADNYSFITPHSERYLTEDTLEQYNITHSGQTPTQKHFVKLSQLRHYFSIPEYSLLVRMKPDIEISIDWDVNSMQNALLTDENVLEEEGLDIGPLEHEEIQKEFFSITNNWTDEQIMERYNEDVMLQTESYKKLSTPIDRFLTYTFSKGIFLNENIYYLSQEDRKKIASIFGIESALKRGFYPFKAAILEIQKDIALSLLSKITDKVIRRDLSALVDQTKLI